MAVVTIITAVRVLLALVLQSGRFAIPRCFWRTGVFLGRPMIVKFGIVPSMAFCLVLTANAQDFSGQLPPSDASQAEALAQLNQFAEVSKANFEKIENIQADGVVFETTLQEPCEYLTYVGDDERKIDGPLIESRESEISIAIDLKSDSFFIRQHESKPSRYRDFKSGKSVDVKVKSGVIRYRSYSNAVATPEHVLQRRPFSDRGIRADDVGEQRFFTRAAPKSLEASVSLDPRTEICSQTWFNPEMLNGLVAAVEKRQFIVWTETVGDKVIIRGMSNEGVQPHYEITFDKSIGGFVTSVDRSSIIAGRRSTSADRFRYEKIVDTYVPVEILQTNRTVESIDFPDEKKIVLKNVKLNQPLAENQFTWQVLEPQDGDHLDDKIQKKQKVFSGGKPCDPAVIQ